MKIKYYSLEESMDILNKFAKEQKLKNTEILKWIVVKTLRLTINQFNNIKQIENEQLNLMKGYILRYINGESLGKIFGFIEFFGNFFDVTENVFDPRLSSEALVKAVLQIEPNYLHKAKIIDLCTGSGCIAITLSKMLNKNIDALDVSPFAIEIAKTNAQKNNANVNFFKFDLNDNWDERLGKYDVIVSNPPYWNASKILNNIETVKNNPLIGFDGGEDGLKYIKLIIKNSQNHLNENGHLILEIDHDQISSVKDDMIKNNFSNIKVIKDYRNIDRVVHCKKTNNIDLTQ